MPTISDTRTVFVALILKLEDFETGFPIQGDSSLKVVSSEGLYTPIIKSGGYFVFTNNCPDAIKITSDKYQTAIITTKACEQRVFRLWLMPSSFAGGRHVYKADKMMHIAFPDFENDFGYALSEDLLSGACEATLSKSDYKDITNQYHVVTDNENRQEIVSITKNLGEGRYCLASAPTQTYKAETARFIPLHRISQGEIIIPDNAKTMLIFCDNQLSTINLDNQLQRNGH